MSTNTDRTIGRAATNGALVIAALILALTVARQPRGPFSPDLTDPAADTEFPPLALMGVNEDTVNIDLASGTEERLIVFFSSACPFCVQSLPVYRSVSELCQPSLILAFTDLKGAELGAWWEEYGRGFSEESKSMSIGSVLGPLSLYQLRGTPTHYLIGTDGRVKHHMEGALTEIPAWLNR